MEVRNESKCIREWKMLSCLTSFLNRNEYLLPGINFWLTSSHTRFCRSYSIWHIFNTGKLNCWIIFRTWAFIIFWKLHKSIQIFYSFKCTYSLGNSTGPWKGYLVRKLPQISIILILLPKSSSVVVGTISGRSISGVVRQEWANPKSIRKITDFDIGLTIFYPV